MPIQPDLDPQHWFCVEDFFLSLIGIVRILGDLVLSGCYDNTVNIFGIQGDKKLVIPGHSGPVKVREKMPSYGSQCCEPVMFILDPGSEFFSIPKNCF